jgi:crotonobetainyl-CoA:carnitine CoA-transferase CaiB-like acyl-CoA transferase
VDDDGKPGLRLGPPVRLAGVEPGPARPAPRLGQHTREILARAGFSESELDDLASQGII